MYISSNYESDIKMINYFYYYLYYFISEWWFETLLNGKQRNFSKELGSVQKFEQVMTYYRCQI
jgi:hypothetical protein